MKPKNKLKPEKSSGRVSPDVSVKAKGHLEIIHRNSLSWRRKHKNMIATRSSTY